MEKEKTQFITYFLNIVTPIVLEHNTVGSPIRTTDQKRCLLQVICTHTKLKSRFEKQVES